jgi:predicted permease
MAAATFMNSNSLPVALLQSLAVTVPGLRWGEDDTKDAIIGRALTYLLLCSTIGQFVSRCVSSLLSCVLSYHRRS